MDRLLSQNGINSFKPILEAYAGAGVTIGNCIDGGAGSGRTARNMLPALADNAVCYAFEPFEGNHRFYKGLDKRVILRKEALAEAEKDCCFHVSSVVAAESEWGRRGMAGYSSVGRLVDDADASPASTRVRCVAADDIVPENRPIGFIKLDLQGGELNALKGMRRVMKNVNFMWIEFSNQPGLFEYLEENDFYLFDTEYMFSVEPTEAVKAHFRISRTRNLSTGRTAWFGFPRIDWADFRRQIQFMKREYGLIQTDLVCVPRSRAAAFKAMIQVHLGLSTAGPGGTENDPAAGPPPRKPGRVGSRGVTP